MDQLSMCVCVCDAVRVVGGRDGGGECIEQAGRAEATGVYTLPRLCRVVSFRAITSARMFLKNKC